MERYEETEEKRKWWTEFMEKQSKELVEEHRAYFAKRRFILADLREKGVMTRNQRKRERKELGDGVAYGVDRWWWESESPKDKAFIEQWRNKMIKNELEHPGKLTTITEGCYMGWKNYECTLKEIPVELKFEGPDVKPDDEDVKRMVQIYKENRTKWYQEGEFNIIFEGNVYALDQLIVETAKRLVMIEYDKESDD